MNEQQLAAVKQALEALKRADSRDGYLTYITEIEALQSIISQNALDKKAENARELGLSYEPVEMYRNKCADGSRCLHGCHTNEPCYTTPPAAQPAPVQEPVAIVVAAEYEDGSTAGHRLEWRGRNEANDFPEGTEFYTTPQPVPVKTYHDGKPWPVQPKPWVGLTDEEVAEGLRKPFWEDAARAIEAILKEKNT